MSIESAQSNNGKVSTEKEASSVTAKRGSFFKKHQLFLSLLALNLFLSGLAFLLLVLRTHFAPDSYIHVFDTFEDFESPVFFSRATYTGAVLRGSQLLFGFNIVLDQRVFYIIMIVATAYANSLVAKLFISFLKQPSRVLMLVVNCVSLLVFINPFIMELILYPECALFVAAGHVFVAASVWFIHKKGWKGFCISLLFLMLVLGIYQAYLGVYFALASSLLWLKHREDLKARAFIVGWIRVFMAGLAAAAFQVVFMKLYSSFFSAGNVYGTVSLSTSGILENVSFLLMSQPYYFSWALGRTLMLPFFFILLVFIVLLIYSLRTLPKRQWVTWAFALITAYGSVFIIHIVASELWVPFRSVFGFWAVIAALVIMPVLVAVSDSLAKRKDGQRLRSTIVFPGFGVTFSALLCILAFTVVWDLSIDNYMTNEADAVAAKSIDARLDEYEEQTGRAVTQFAITLDAEPTYTYPEIRYSAYESNVSSRGITWSLTYLINMNSDRELLMTDMPETIKQEYFSGQDWQALDLDKQLVIIDDCAYYCSY